MKIVLTLCLMLLPSVAVAADGCDALLPGPLEAILGKAFPAYRSPLETDNLPEDIDWRVKQGGTACLGIAVADFDGDARKDWAVGLAARQGTGAMVVVALARGRTWALHTLTTWRDGRNRLYIAADKPGIYKRTESLDGPLEPGEIDPLRCSNNVVVFGATESSGVAYCFARGKWQHVWISD